MIEPGNLWATVLVQLDSTSKCGILVEEGSCSVR